MISLYLKCVMENKSDLQNTLWIYLITRECEYARINVKRKSSRRRERRSLVLSSFKGHNVFAKKNVLLTENSVSSRRLPANCSRNRRFCSDTVLGLINVDERSESPQKKIAARTRARARDEDTWKMRSGADSSVYFTRSSPPDGNDINVRRWAGCGQFRSRSPCVTHITRA